MHGGISPQMTRISDINKINRLDEVPFEGIMCDLLWADPVDDIHANQTDFKEN
jgi:serine/threonine-protein phosphatase 2B catalytic subunit